jgi:hypothetical protein
MQADVPLDTIRPEDDTRRSEDLEVGYYFSF